MGTKSSNVITKKEMLPLFQVISDLEKPLTTSVSTQNVSSYFENSSFVNTENDTTYDRRRDRLYFSDSIIERDIIGSDISSYSCVRDSQLLGCMSTSESNSRRRNKKRRRLKDGFSIEKPVGDVKECCECKKLSPKNDHKYLSNSDHTELILQPEIHSTMTSDFKLPNIEKRSVGMFSSMTTDVYKDEVDLSRHFKNITDSETDVEKKFKKTTEYPIYETPNNSSIKTSKRKRKKHLKGKVSNLEHYSHMSKDASHLRKICGSKNKVSKKTIIKEYEVMLETLLQKCQQKDNLISEKDHYLEKMKKKLKQTLAYNNQFAEENDFLKRQYEDMKKCIEQYKNHISSIENQKIIPENVQGSDSQFTDQAPCPRCSIIELSAIKIEKENMKLNEDIIMLKNVVFRLNVQLSRYQEKLRMKYTVSNKELQFNGTKSKSEDGSEYPDHSIPSLPVFPSGVPADQDDQNLNSRNSENHVNNSDKNKVDKSDCIKDENKEETFTINYEGCTVWGDVNTHTLAPLLNAYQESLMEKDDLIHDYEKEFNRFTIKLKQVISENNNLHTKCVKMGTDLTTLQETCGLAVTERDELRKENHNIKEKNIDIEKKLQDLHELYDQKVESMSRDYTLIHQEYFRTKAGLAMVQGRCQALEDQQKNIQGENVIPSKIHSAKIEECKKLFEELKNRYELDKSKLQTRISILEENNGILEKKHIEISKENHDFQMKIKRNDKIIRRYRHTVIAYRKDFSTLKASNEAHKRRATRATNLCRQLTVMLEQATGDERFQHIKAEAMAVQKKALKELDALELKMKEKDLNLVKIKEENTNEITKLKKLLKEKEILIEALKRHLRDEKLQKYVEYGIGSENKLQNVSKKSED